MLKDHGVRRSGKLDHTPLVQAPELCGPDSHAMQAKMRMQKRHSVSLNAGNVVPTEPWDAVEADYRAIERIEKRKLRGGATFTPSDAC
jgi:hypothetical protein